jgi:DNA-binding transcriptional regulator YdaS (Cro superfamily)
MLPMKRTRLHKRPKNDPALEAAIQSVGGVTALAHLLRVRHSAVSRWKRAPLKRVPELSRVTGIPRHVLRPDFYEAPEPPARRKQKEAA